MEDRIWYGYGVPMEELSREIIPDSMKKYV
jgi:hypothetical protein